MKQRTWFITIQLHPPQILQSRFTCIKLLIYNSSCFFIYTVLLTPEVHASYYERALQVHNFFWCENWLLQLFNFIQHHCIFYCFVVLWDLFCFFDRTANIIFIRLTTVQVPGSSFAAPDNRREPTFRGGGFQLSNV